MSRLSRNTSISLEPFITPPPFLVSCCCWTLVALSSLRPQFIVCFFSGNGVVLLFVPPIFGGASVRYYTAVSHLNHQPQLKLLFPSVRDFRHRALPFRVKSAGSFFPRQLFYVNIPELLFSELLDSPLAAIAALSRVSEWTLHLRVFMEHAGERTIPSNSLSFRLTSELAPFLLLSSLFHVVPGRNWPILPPLCQSTFAVEVVRPCSRFLCGL